MPDRPRHAAAPVYGPVDGWAQLAGDPNWTAARFATSAAAGRHQLHIQLGGSGGVSVDLGDVTSLDELIDGPAGYHHLELEIHRTAAVQTVWPPDFTDAVLAALQATLDTAPAVASTATPPATQEIDLRTPKRRANVGLIGALGLVGCGALIVGALGLRDPAPTRSDDTRVLTETTLRGPASTAAPTVSTMIPPVPTLPSVDECSPGSPVTTTVPDPEAVDSCEAG